ncbi:hypothetical protein HYPBUDRAFT_102345 [Hyphopichia burtonii NRRL Y-1933]|uniref:CN hydrolase domain-containing protein n=1 Tax=Hyphopichia burtonii NRRL Y-1933 TaxID=984485 RepID=A0A1E4RSH6_9ASCO|nr:hypothetical protein HYPBUDRAFT_102345 [Hyphopichia burtonii NRRL Y-1933]ODV70197.1 hypothetical protein HYPBUDRAFT_102345 [Hyphopichia burtonii NRRL Y-1933]
MKIACGQLCSLSSLKDNSRIVIKLIKQSILSKVEVLFLPEATDYILKDAKELITLASKTQQDFLTPIQKELKLLNERNKSQLKLAIGIHEPTSLEKVRNIQIWINEAGLIEQKYAKIHLFDINIPNGPNLKELDSVEPGNSILSPFAVRNWNIGFAICYDIRFIEMTLKLRNLGANLITFPSAFTTKTGEAHWLELGRARAIDSQCYIVMAAQCGEHQNGSDKKRVSYGQSIIIDPWGEVIARGAKYSDPRSVDDQGDYYQLVTAEISHELVEQVRSNLPVFSHRRPDVY